MAAEKKLNKLYDKYAPVLYPIVLDIFPVKNDADDILIALFKKIHQEDKPEVTLVSLIHMLLKIVKEEPNRARVRGNYSIKSFAALPLFYNCVITHESINEYCLKNNCNRSHFAKKLRAELFLTRKV